MNIRSSTTLEGDSVVTKGNINSNRQEISLESRFDAVVRHGGTTVELNAGGAVIVYTNSDVSLRPPANDDLPNPQAVQIGDLHRGAIYVGKSATTGFDLYAARRDELLYLSFDEALKAAEEMRKQPGRENAHVPTLDELGENLYENNGKGALRGTFNTTGCWPHCFYLSSTPSGNREARCQRFTDGNVFCAPRYRRLSVRLVW